MLIGLCYKLRMFGIPIDGLFNIFCNNEAVTKSSINPDTVLKKKNMSIALQQATESVAAKIALIFCETSRTNHADLFTNIANHIDRKRLMGYICSNWDIKNTRCKYLS